MSVSNIQTRATLIGLTAPVCWGMTVGLIRSITESFGLAAGLTLLYGATIVFLSVLLGRPRLRAFPRRAAESFPVGRGIIPARPAFPAYEDSSQLFPPTIRP